MIRVVDVMTLDQRNPRHASQCKKIDWNDSSDRKWLMNHLHWAMNNSRSVTLATNDWESARQSESN
jgi:hypothetical protein